MNNASQEVGRFDPCPNAETGASNREENSCKSRPACSPVIQVTWRATADFSKDPSNGGAHQCHQTPLRRQPRHPHLVSYHSTSSSSGGGSGSASGSSGSDSMYGVYRMAWHTSSPKWFLGSPRVQQLKTSESSSSSRSDFMLQSDLKGMHLSQSYGNNDHTQGSQHSFTASKSGHQTSSTSASPAKLRSFNPFEMDLVNTMHMSSYSPSVLSKCGTPSKVEQTDGFNWDIEQIAVLYPKELDNCPDERNSTPTYDPEMEDKIQNAINNFFASNVDMPSPWPESNPKNKISTPSSMAASDGKYPKHLTSLKREVSTTKKLAVYSDLRRVAVKQRNVWCQTVLTLPTNVDLEDILKNHFTFTENQAKQNTKAEPISEEYDVKEANLSTSSLRRKLFANNDYEPPIPALTKESPSNVTNEVCAIVQVSQFNYASTTPEKSLPTSRLLETPDKYTSSPVTETAGWHQRASLTPPMDVASPTISPIKPSNMENEAPQQSIPFKNYVTLHHPSFPGNYSGTNEDGMLGLKDGASPTRQRLSVEPFEGDMEPQWLEISKHANISKISFMETTEDMVSTIPSGSGTTNHDTGYQTNHRFMSTSSSCQEVTSFSTSIQAPLQLCQKAVRVKTSPSTIKTMGAQTGPPTISQDLSCRPSVIKERRMSISADDLPSTTDDPRIANEDATMWSPLVSSTPSRKQYLITDANG